MAMDVFQIRLDCIALVKKLNASQQAIAKVVDFAVKYASVAADDVWDCIITECEKSSLNTKLNILFLLDALLLSIVDPVGYSSFSDPGSSSATKLEGSSSSSNSTITASTYLTLASRDLGRIVDSVVPKEDWDAVRMNATDTQKVLSSWKRVGMFDLARIDTSIDDLQIRKEALSKLPSCSLTRFSKQDTLRRIEEDRERHKRLRERVWILPAKSFADAVPQRVNTATNKASLTSVKKAEGAAKAVPSSTSKPDALTIEFDDMWESVSDLNEDDYDKMQDVDRKWWGSEPFHEKQLAVEKERTVANEPDVTFEHDDERKRRRSKEAEDQTTPKRKYDHDDERKDYSDRNSRDDRPPPNRWRKIGPSHNSDVDGKSSTSRGGSYENNWKRRNNNQNRRNRW